MPVKPKVKVAPVDRVERWPISKLVPYVGNPRTHAPKQIDQIAASMKEFGQAQLIVVDEKGEIIAGHGRVLAAQKLGWKEMTVGIAIGWTEPQKRAYRIADNQIALTSAWDGELLSGELAGLKGSDFDIGILGFTNTELERMLSEESGEAFDHAPAPPVNPVTRRGDLWELGEHRLLCGDATDANEVADLLPDQQADMTFTDPPYNVAYTAQGERDEILNDDLGGAYEAFIKSACDNILAATSGAIYICMSSSEIATLQRAFKEAGGHWSTFIIIWAKDAFTIGRSDYQRQYEPILYGWKEGNSHYWCGDRNQGDVWHFEKPMRSELHPTMKPVGLVEHAIRNSSEVGDIVFDPFGGSGTTMIAAELTKRRCCMIELDPRYCDVIIARWQELTKGKARLGNKTFEQVSRARKKAAEAA